MTLWFPFRCQYNVGAALVLSVALHSLALLGLIQYNMRSHANLNFDKSNMRPAIEVTLLTSVARPQQQDSGQAVPQTKLPTPSRAIYMENRQADDVANDARANVNPSDSLAATSKLITGATEHSRNDGPPVQVSPPPAPRQPDQQPIQVARPDYAYNPQPTYPMLLREQGVGGVVWLRVWVDSEGLPVEIKLAKGSGYRLLDDAALRAVKLWRFIPAKHGEQRLASWVEFPIRFTLNG